MRRAVSMWRRRRGPKGAVLARSRAASRCELLKNAYGRTDLEDMIVRSRFGTGRIVDDGVGFELQLAKPG
jgi:hypothetical protein